MEDQVLTEQKNERSLSLGELLFLVKKNWLIITIITVACTIIGGIYGLFIKERSYTATNTSMVMVDLSKEGMKNSNEYTAYMYSTYLINTYENFIKSHHVVDKVINELKESKGYELEYDDIIENLEFETEENSLIVVISYTAHGNTKEQESIDVVNTLLDTSIDIANNELDENSKVKFTALADSIVPIDKAFEAEGKRGASIIIIVSFLVGLVISFAICLVKYLSDDTFKSKEDFKRIVGIDVIATIPEIIESKGEKNNEK